MTARIFLFLALAPALSLLAGSGEAEEVRHAGPDCYNWHFGPFFEYRRSAEPDVHLAAADARYRTYWAFRPFYSQIQSEATVERDFIWPLGTEHVQEGRMWWRALVAYGQMSEEGVPRDATGSSFNIFPLWFSGVTRQNREYWGAFPFYGEHPHFLLMDNWRFVLWPIWMDYDVKDVHHQAVLWPLVTWKEDNRETAGVWPFYSHARLRESDHWYALWPIVTWATYDEDRDTSGLGHSWMVWPLVGNVHRMREREWSFLPPFFSYAETPGRRRWRCPWPLVDVEVGRVRNRTSVFPLYEYCESYAFGSRGKTAERPVAEEQTHRFLWVLAESSTLRTATTEERRVQVWPFVTWESRRARQKGSCDMREVASYLRVWPFYSAAEERGRCRRRALELIPIRHAEGLDRNWSPFWTFWESESCPAGGTLNVLFWNLIRWHAGE